MNGLFLNTAAMRLRRVRQRVRAFVDLAGDKGESGDAAGKWAMVTLTYRDCGAWQPGHITDYIKSVRMWAARRGIKLVYCWVAELQLRGAVHYHVMVKLPKVGGKQVRLPYPDSVGRHRKVSQWSWGLSNVAWVRKSGKRYLSKYTSKGSEGRGEMPKGLRLCGAGGLGLAARQWWTWLLSPAYVRQETEPADHVKRVRGGWRCRAKAALYRFIPTPWCATPMPDLGGVWLSRLSPDRWAAASTDPQPVDRYLSRQRVKDAVFESADIMFRGIGQYLCNPWAVIG